MNDVSRLTYIPPLENGDHLTRDEFERRYEAMPGVKKAELVNGVVFMPSPVNADRHGEPHLDISGWVAIFKAMTPGVRAADNSTVRLDLDTEPQPDVSVFIDPAHGGQVRISREGYIEGGPELAIEVAATTASLDLGWKLGAYLRNGVREYLVWRVLDNEFDWFILRGGQYDRLTPDSAGIIRSETFPGLWLDVPALIRRDLATVLAVLQLGIASPEHAAFVQSLQQRRRQP